MTAFKAHLEPNPGKCSVEVEGTPVSGCTKVALEQTVGGMPVLTLTLRVKSDIEGEGRVIIEPEQAGLLQSLGWKPPEEDPMDVIYGTVVGGNPPSDDPAVPAQVVIEVSPEHAGKLGVGSKLTIAVDDIPPWPAPGE